jgi:chromosome segregation ATPase
MATWQCPRCGTANRPGSRFCGACGNVAPAPAAPAPVAPPAAIAPAASGGGLTADQARLLQDLHNRLQAMEQVQTQQIHAFEQVTDALREVDRSLSQALQQINALERTVAQQPTSTGGSSDRRTLDQIRSDVSSLKSEISGGWFSSSLPNLVREIKDKVERLPDKLDRIEDRLKNIERKVGA